MVARESGALAISAPQMWVASVISSPQPKGRCLTEGDCAVLRG